MWTLRGGSKQVYTLLLKSLIVKGLVKNVLLNVVLSHKVRHLDFRMLLVSLFYRGSALKFIIDNWMLLCVALVSGLLLVTPVLQGAMDLGLSPTLVVQMMNKERANLLDVRTLPEFNEEHIVGSEHLDLLELQNKLNQVQKNKQQPLIMVCASGSRSQKAVAIAKKLGFEQVHSLSGGLKSWREASLPTQKKTL